MSHQSDLARVDWSKFHDVDAQAIYTFAVLACRANRGACFCGAHVTPVASSATGRPAEPPKRSESKPTPLPAADELVDDALNKTERKILVALAQLGRQLDRPQLGLMTGLSATTGTFGVALARLRRDGMIDGGGAGMTITARGLDELGEWTPLPTGHALFEFWCAKLGTTAEKILRALRRSNSALSKADLGDATGLSSGTGTFGVALAELRRLQLIQGGGPAMTLSPDFARAIEPTIGVFDKSSGKSVRIDARGGHTR